FHSLFRKSRTSFYILNEKIKFDPIFYNQFRNPQADSALQLATTLYIMGRLGNSTVHFCEQLQIGEGTAYLYRNRVMTAVLKQLPGSEDYHTVRREIEQETQFPGCVGFLDGTDM
ncbi:hypothetical protein HOY82DRAFT_495460, partial [Tuber indicum]